VPRRPRQSLAAFAYHVMNRSIRRIPLFTQTIDYRAFTSILAEGLAHQPVQILAYCIMPNHWHLVLRPDNQSCLSRYLHWITTTHARRWHRRRGTEGWGPVYKGRFVSVPIDSVDDVIRVCRYVERNPVKAGLVASADRWIWSSAAERRTPRHGIPLGEIAIFRSDAWLQFVNDAVPAWETAGLELVLAPHPWRPARRKCGRRVRQAESMASVGNRPVPPS
jgi:putative transposase